MKNLPYLALLLNLRFALAQETTTRGVADCSCGFYDQDADLIFTDTSIVYFNESGGIPDDFHLESFEHKYDRGWNALYRQGAAIENIEVYNDTYETGGTHVTGLALYCDPADDNGLVTGASMRTSRQDIFFGSFRSSMRAPRKWLKGSALSMLLDHNKTERWDIDIMNTDNSSVAWVSMLQQGEFSDTWLGVNFTNFTDAGLDPWYYLEYRVDWTRDRLDYYVGNMLWKSYTKKENGTLPSTPSALKWQHWSLGNEYNTQGPPGVQSQANIAWTRIFFNSSLTTDDDRKAFDERCSPTAACLMSDNTLRGSSTYPSEALQPWKQHHKKWTVPWVPLIIVIALSAIFTLITVKTVWRRFNWDSVQYFLGLKKRPEHSPRTSTVSESTSYNDAPRGTLGSGSESSSRDGSVRRLPRDTSYTSLSPPPTYSGAHTPAPQYQTPLASQWGSRVNSTDDLAIKPLPHSDSVSSHLYMAGRGTTASRIATAQSGEGSRHLQHYSASSNPFLPHSDSTPLTPEPEGNLAASYMPTSISQTLATPGPEATNPLSSSEKVADKPVGSAKGTKAEASAATAVVASGDKAPLVRQRVDYLAGFIAMSAILVTLNHFGLTFWAAVIIPSVRPHYSSETWARKTIASYFLDPLWIGPFLMISTRFLVSNYLRTGRLDNMAQKIVSRPFRLLTPVVFIATLEYFLEDSGALNWLEYLSSVTWSPWPFTTIVANPGIFISELIQLAFLIPNAAPMITYNYCTGVLWTIPVQLQGAWQTLLALIMVKECKTPWKRFAFYAFCIVNHWYGLSWGSYYYAGVLLADLDLTFKYRTWLHARPWIYYPLLNFLIIVALGGFTIDMVVQWTGVNYATYEYGWHPDIATGLTISQAGNAVYPDYFIPRLNALLTTVSMQMVVEINPTIQKILSVKPLQWLFPHVFTIYLIHGFIFWSIGSWAMISIFSYGCPYWLCVLLTAIICYGALFAVLPILTPPIEAVGKNFTLSLWEHASQEPLPRKLTTFPFGRELLARDVEGAGKSSSEAESNVSFGEKSDPFRDPDQQRNPFADPGEKGKMRGFEKIEEV